jgi:hypothetical protein
MMFFFLEPEVSSHSEVSNCTILQYPCKFIACLHITKAFKIKSSLFINNIKYWFSADMVVNLGWWAMEPCYDIPSWWRFYCN